MKVLAVIPIYRSAFWKSMRHLTERLSTTRDVVQYVHNQVKIVNPINTVTECFDTTRVLDHKATTLLLT